MKLPDCDEIPSLICDVGMFSLKRWPSEVGKQIDFLLAVSEKFGSRSTLSIHAPYDGYPGYIKVVPEAEWERRARIKEAEERLYKQAMDKLTPEERRALGV